MQIDLTGKSAFVSGSTKGIGRVVAAHLAAAGAATTINGRGVDQVAAAVDELRLEHPGAVIEGVAADIVTDEGAQALAEALPAVDILVNNLGVFAPQPVLEIDDDIWQRSFWEVNVMSGIRLTRQYLPGMRERRWGRVQFIASDSALVIPEETLHYRLTKTALLGVSRGFAKASAGTGVTVNAVISGPTHTEGVEEFVRGLVGDTSSWDEAQAEFMKRHRPSSPIQRLIEPEEIAQMVTYLASEQAWATNGDALRVDGQLADGASS